VVAVVGFIIWMWLDMRAVENSARACEPLISTLAKLRDDAGHYPPVDSKSLSTTLVKHCHYQPMRDGYVLVLTGSDFNLQAYEYDSRTQSWQWD